MEQKIDFEKSLKTLEENVNKIENEVLPLEVTLEIFESSSKIIKQLEEILQEAKIRIKDVR